MDSSAMIKRTLEYQKTAFDAGFNTMVILQGQVEKLATDLWEKSSAPKEALQAFEDAVAEFKKRRDEVKKMMDESFAKFEAMLIP